MGNKIKTFLSSIMIISMIVASIPVNAFAFDGEEDITDLVPLNKEIRFDSFDEGPSVLSINIPEAGRIRVWAKDLKEDYFDDAFMFKKSDRKNSMSRRWTKKGDQVNSGWISVTPGNWEVILDFDIVYGGGDEVFLIEYQTSSQYFGETENNNGFSTANKINFNQTYEADYSWAEVIDSSDEDVDYYKFTVPESGLVTMTLKSEYYDYSMYFELYIADENNNKKLVTDYNSFYRSDFSLKGKTTYRLRLGAGDYYLKVEPGYVYDREYTLRVDYTSESALDTEQEFNDSSRTANLIQPNAKYKGNLSSNNDVDWYKVVLDDTSEMNVEFWIPEDIGERNAQIEMFNSDLETLYSETTSTDVHYQSKKKEVPAGTYYVRVQNDWYYLNDNYDYSVKVNAYTYLKPVTNVKSEMTKYNGYKISWNPSKGASGYSIYTKSEKGSTYVYRGFTEENEFELLGLTPGEKYSVVITVNQMINGQNVECEYANKVFTLYTLKKVVQNSVKKYSSSKVKVSWKDIRGESGYQICKMTKKSGKYITSGTYTTTKSYINISAKKGKYFYYRVRAYKTVNGQKVYAPWSTIKRYKL